MCSAALPAHQRFELDFRTTVELAHRLGQDEKAFHRLRDPLRRSAIETLEVALRTLGKRVEVTVRDAARQVANVIAWRRRLSALGAAQWTAQLKPAYLRRRQPQEPNEQR